MHKSSNIQVIIPMSGFGERFRRAGYDMPKPLIEVEGKPIIAHVCDLFPDVEDILFICNQDHLDEPRYRMREILEELRPQGRILGIGAHKLGPVHAVRLAEAEIDRDRPAVVNYCDFTCYWDWQNFCRFVEESDCDGAIPAYRGFHPHSLGSTFYAYMREQNGWASDIQEKQPYTETPMREYASSGTYYFRSGSLMLEAMKSQIDQEITVGGEYYVSLTYKPLFAAGKRIAVYPLQHFMQWGTPEDVAVYNRWSAIFHRLADDPASPPRQDGMVLLPAAGLGTRFADAGYDTPKALIEVSGRPMLLQALSDLPRTDAQSVVLRQDMPGLEQIVSTLEGFSDGMGTVVLPGPTDGQARSCALGMADADPDKPVTIGVCDTGLLYDSAAFETALSQGDADLLVWAIRGHPDAIRRPQMFGWLSEAPEDPGRVTGVSVKTSLGDPATDAMVTGIFTFRTADAFNRCVDRLFERDGRINGEFYLDSAIEDALALGLTVRLFEVDHYIGWGTPEDLKSFEYWQSCFHKWDSHPYRLDKDARIPADQRGRLAERYARLVPEVPAV